MYQQPTRLKTLLHLFVSNTISADEYQELLKLLNEDSLSADLSVVSKELWSQSAAAPFSLPDEKWNERMQYLMAAFAQEETSSNIVAPPVKTMPVWYKFRWAASVLLILSSVTLYLFLRTPKTIPQANITITKPDTSKAVLPGGNKALLTLADGSTIELDNTANGTIANQGSAKIIKLQTGQLAYNSSGKTGKEILYNTLSTPRGGQYQVVLSDGTMVWLNSTSSLRYPTVFSGADRKVEITGEAYFEVAKNAAHPFKVKINAAGREGGEVEVLGTHFNINAFDNEDMVRTTLFEGSVQLNKTTGRTILKPGQQLQSKQNGTELINETTDLEEVIAWKEGRFQFENARIDYVMRQIARWYDIEVEYKATISRHFDGTIAKNVNLKKVLDMLELTGEVTFTVKGNKVIVGR